MIYSFVLDDSSTSWRFTTRTEQLTNLKCCKPLQKMRVRLGACKAGLSPHPHPRNFILLIVPRRNLCCGLIVFFVLESNVCAV